MKRRLIELSALLLLLGFVGLLVVSSGIVPVKASSGHWAITRAVLSFAMRRSVETHSIGTTVRELDDPALVLRGAGHYDLGCRPCHGAPGERSSVITDHLTPHPPYLPEEVANWEPEELFEIVKHGIKMTGMPAWPALERDDEVWAVVAFLLRVRDLDAGEYRRLVRGEPEDAIGDPGLEALEGAPDAVAMCGRCHGRHGLGRGLGASPRLAGQREAYLADALRAYASGHRHSGIMEPVAAALDEETLRALARVYAGAGGRGAGARVADPARLERGERIARQGIPDRNVPPCVECHGPGDGARNPNYPVLAGQYADYLALQVWLFREERRGGSPYVDIMREVVHSLEPGEAAAVAAWYASLPWDAAPAGREGRP